MQLIDIKFKEIIPKLGTIDLLLHWKRRLMNQCVGSSVETATFIPMLSQFLSG
jgi:hypothetical protein